MLEHRCTCGSEERKFLQGLCVLIGLSYRRDFRGSNWAEPRFLRSRLQRSVYCFIHRYTLLYIAIALGDVEGIYLCLLQPYDSIKLPSGTWNLGKYISLRLKDLGEPNSVRSNDFTLAPHLNNPWTGNIWTGEMVRAICSQAPTLTGLVPDFCQWHLTP